MSYTPFITDRGHLSVLEGQRYVVLRAMGEAAQALKRVQDDVRAELDGQPASFPNAAHVTLRGFPAGTDLDRVVALVESWSVNVGPLEVEITRAATFPAPDQIVICEVRKTDALKTAFASLLEATLDAGLPDWPGRFGIDEWIFHTSVAYCRFVPADVWTDVATLVATVAATGSCIVNEVEIAAFDGSAERSGGIFRLAG